MDTEVSNDNIEEINNRLKYLYDNFGIENIPDPLEIGNEDIYIPFPKDEYMEEPLSVLDFFLYTEEIKSLKQIDNSTVRSDNIRQTIIKNKDDFYNLPIFGNWITTEGYFVRIIENPFYIGLLSARDNTYNEDYGVYPCSSYHAIEIVYTTKDYRMTEEAENNLIGQILFALSCRFNDSITIGSYIDWSDLDEKISEEHEDNYELSMDLIPYSPTMEMYSEALYISNDEIKYLYFYKIIEYFSPIVSRKKSYELLNQKLDALSISKRDHRYLESIFSLTRKYDLSLRDKELANTVLRDCIDIVEIYGYLPDLIQKSLSKIYQFTDIESIEVDKREQIIKKIANILYSTRNNYVHAKSNYNMTGDECKNEDLKQLNIFMAKLCYCLIVWNGRQNEDFRI